MSIDDVIAKIEDYVVQRIEAISRLAPATGGTALPQLYGEALVAAQVHANLRSQTVCTQRDVYYRLVRQFKTQRDVNNHIHRLAVNLGVQRSELFVVAGARGLVGGALELDGCNLEASTTGIQISGTYAATFAQPPSISSRASYVLVIEKEAVFCRLLHERIHHLLPCVLFTGKGFPDVATRTLVRAVVDELSRKRPDGTVVVVGLADFNPAGVHILLQYRTGGGGGKRLVAPPVPRLRWLGLHDADLPVSSVGKPFAARDKAMAANLMAAVPAEWAPQVAAMQRREAKFEIEELYHGHDSSFAATIVAKILQRRYI